MPLRVARLVTITWADGDVEQYEHVEVLEICYTRKDETPRQFYKSLTVTDSKKVGTHD